MNKSTWTRSDVTFPSGETTCAAWLYSPAGQKLDLPAPIIVMAHGLGGVKEQRLDAFAERFVEAGYACLVFDYRYFGASGGQPRQLLDVASQRADWKAAIAFVRDLPTVDPDRVVAWGSSFGGGHTIVTAAQDKRLAAAIAQCPVFGGKVKGYDAAAVLKRPGVKKVITVDGNAVAVVADTFWRAKSALDALKKAAAKPSQ